MKDEYTRAVLERAAVLHNGEAALCMLDERVKGNAWRTWLAAGLAALMALYPSVSAAQMLL